MAMRMGGLTAGMLGIAGLAALLAVEASRTTRQHRETAEQVLGDYAALATEGVANRLQSYLASRLNPILGAIDARQPANRASLEEGLNRSSAELASGIGWAGWLVREGGIHTLWIDDPAMADTSLATAILSAARAIPEFAYLGLLGRGDQLIVYVPPRASLMRTAVYGMALDTLGHALGRFLAQDQILPQALTRGVPLGDDVGVTISLGGRPVAHRGTTADTRFHAADSLGAMFGGMTVEVRLAERLAPILVIGGLPPSRLPLLGAILFLMLALAATTLVQFRQRARLAQLQEEFVTGTSHELRTPLAQIRLFAETLRLGRVRSEAERERAIAVVEREARRLEHLVANLLHFSRTEPGGVRVVPEAVDLGLLTREIVADFAPLAEKAGVTVAVEVDQASLRTMVDPGAWRHVLLNLLDNGIKYGGRGTTVTVRVSAEGSTRRLTVGDQGPGVPPADRNRIWNRFWRGTQARASNTPGAGIGLATVRDLVRQHGGECWVETLVPHGAQFVVRIPEGVCES